MIYYFNILTNIPDGPVSYVIVSAKKLSRPKRQGNLVTCGSEDFRLGTIIFNMYDYELTSLYRSSQPETYLAQPMPGQPAVPVPPS